MFFTYHKMLFFLFNRFNFFAVMYFPFEKTKCRTALQFFLLFSFGWFCFSCRCLFGVTVYNTKTIYSVQWTFPDWMQESSFTPVYPTLTECRNLHLHLSIQPWLNAGIFIYTCLSNPDWMQESSFTPVYATAEARTLPQCKWPRYDLGYVFKLFSSLFDFLFCFVF